MLDEIGRELYMLSVREGVDELTGGPQTMWKVRDATDSRRALRPSQRAENRQSGCGTAGIVEQAPAELDIGLG